MFFRGSQSLRLLRLDEGLGVFKLLMGVLGRLVGCRVMVFFIKASALLLPSERVSLVEARGFFGAVLKRG